jgi:uncharacterized membrane protein
MSFGPIELLVLKFPGNQFSGEIVPALRELLDNGTIRIVDLFFVITDEDGNVEWVEANAAGVETGFAEFAELANGTSELLSEDDAAMLTAGLEPNSSAALMLFENTWATSFVEAVRKANGEVILNERIPRVVIEQLVADLAEAEAAAGA